MEVLIEVIKSEAGIDPLDPENDTNGEGKLFSSVLDWNSWKVDFNEMKVESPDVSYDNILDIKCEENAYESSYPEVKYEPEFYSLQKVVQSGWSEGGSTTGTDYRE
ncbi:uncharacterized protein [Periplaneta americana]|uniref:uncharacterized protein isoform X2 n=1 Tax=Periplaneta americana TaxID=6978 RepID=UPI0037E80B2C